MSKKEFYGIDLGTTYSCIATINSDDIVEVITNPKTGAPTTPSAVAFLDDGTMVVGESAKNNLVNSVENTVVFIKREMSNDSYTRTIQGRTYDQVDISSFILKELVDFANQKRKDEEGKDPIYDVVITVPAYFGKKERDRTIAAGEKAGLNVLQLINEPTAAALSFGKKNKSNRTILVYDLGGGTFDVSIMRIENGLINTLSTTGDNHLGGADWDRAIIDYALDKINLSYDDLDTQEKGTMIISAEALKKTLTSQEQSTYTFVCRGIRNIDISRAEFEANTKRLMNRTMLLVDEAIDLAVKDNSIKSIEDIDEVLLVGGSTMMPMVKDWVKKKFNKEPKLVDPHMAVAKGAALTAAQNDKGYIKGGLTLGKDKGSRTYGMSAFSESEDRMMVFNLIMRNDDLVIRKEINSFSTRFDNQSTLEFHFYESESTKEVMEVDDRLELKSKTGELSWGYPVQKNTPVKIIVERDVSGSVTVWAECEGHKAIFEIVTAGGNGISSK